MADALQSMPDAPLISIVICSRDRPASLRATLASLAAMTIPAGVTWELVVVDNGSVPLDTAGIFTSGIRPRVVREPVAGLSNARNRGVAAARGRYICWTDDDVLIEPDWLAAYADAFARHPEAALFGGPIVPLLIEPATRWVAQAAAIPALAGFVAARGFGDDGFSLSADDHRQPWGANFAVRADVQRRYPYDPALGAGAAAAPLGEESAVIAAILRGGGAGFWLPAASVRHVIGADRQTMAYFLAYFERAAATAAYQRDRGLPGAASVPRLARWPQSFLQLLLAVTAPFARFALVPIWRGLGLRLLARRAFIAGLLDRDGSEHGRHQSQSGPA